VLSSQIKLYTVTFLNGRIFAIFGKLTILTLGYYTSMVFLFLLISIFMVIYEQVRNENTLVSISKPPLKKHNFQSIFFVSLF